MKKQEDIGLLLKEKLEGVQKSPNTFLWNKINTTLDKEKKRRRKFLYFWFSGVGVSILFLLFYTVPSHFISDSIVETSLESDTNAPVDNTTKTSGNINAEESKTLTQLNTSEKEITDTYNSEIPKKNTSNGMPLQKERKNRKHGKRVVLDSVTTYRYYNSSDGTQVETTEKHIIDSLLINSKKMEEEIPTKSVDSLLN